MRILVIEDDLKVAEALREGLERERHAVAVARSGERGYFLLSAQRFDLVILDVMLPGADGINVLATLRQHDTTTPVLILTARDAVADRVRGLDAGADDYMVKPFAFPELVARVRALQRRGRAETPARLAVADLQIDVVSRRVVRGGRAISLTVREFELLAYLLSHQGQVVSREMLARDVWKETGRATPLDNVIDVHVARLRRKVDDPSNVKLIHTVRGVGFIVQPDEP